MVEILDHDGVNIVLFLQHRPGHDPG